MSEVPIFNIASSDPLSGFEDDKGPASANIVHIRIQQRNGRKTLTTVQGIPQEFDLKKIAKACKKEFACNGTVVEHPEYGEVIQMQGDQRVHIKTFLVNYKLVKKEHIKVHGF